VKVVVCQPMHGEELARLKAAALNLIGLLSDELVRSEQLVAGSVEPW
jgi:hypothetical protein